MEGGVLGVTPQENFRATPFTLAYSASPNIMIAISDEELLIIL